MAYEAPPVKHWRDETPLQPPRRRLHSQESQRLKIFLVGALTLTLAGSFAGLLSWFGPVPRPYFFPFWISEYQARQIPFVPMAQPDLDAIRGYFPQIQGDPVTRQEGHQIRQQLVRLKELGQDDDVVVYLRALALLDDHGAIQILPGDASPDNVNSWIPLRVFLEELRACPSRHKLLVLDIMDPLPMNRLGVLFHNVASAVPDELNEVPDPNRLVLCSCAPGQNSFVSQALGRSVFSYYLEEGLKGHAEGYQPGRRADGQIWVLELANFLRARVDRWSRMNAGHRQTPILYGSGADFPLLSLDVGREPASPQALPKLAYPDWLLEAWKQRDRWWSNGGFRADPRAFQRLQAVLRMAESDWRGDYDVRRIQQNHLSFFDRLVAQLDASNKLVKPSGVSLAQEEASGQELDKKTLQLFRDWFDLARRQLALAKPEEQAPLRAKLLQDLQAKVKDMPEYPLEAAVFRLAIKEGADSAGLQLLDQALHLPGRPAPRFAESQVLPLLAEMSKRAEPRNSLATDLVLLMLEVTRRGEAAMSRPDVFAWAKPFIDEAAQERHEGEVLFLAGGYVPAELARRSLQGASRRFEAVLTHSDKILQAQQTLDEAMAQLPWYLPYLDMVPALEKSWEQAAVAGKELNQLLQAGPPPFAPASAAERARLLLDLNERISAIQTTARRLDDRLQELGRPFAAENRQRLIRAAKLPQSGPEVLAAIEALLRVPSPLMPAEERAAVWKAGHDLARVLLEETLSKDAEDDRLGLITPEPEAWAAEPALLRNNLRARNRGVFALAMLKLGGLTAEQLKPIQDVVDQATKNPAVSLWSRAGFHLRTMWANELAHFYHECPTPQAKNQLLWILPPLDSFAGIDDREISETTILRMQKAHALWAWLEDYYRYRARDIQGLGLDSPALQQFRNFLTNAALAHPDIAQPPPERYVAIHPASELPRLRPDRPSSSLMLELQRVLPEGISEPIELTFLKEDAAWLEIAPRQVRIPAAEDSAKAMLLPVTVPLTVSLQRGMGRPQVAPPPGFLVEAKLGGKRTFHRVVPVAMLGLSQEVDILLSANPKEPVPTVDEIRLRPGKVPQAYFVYLKNLTAQPKKIAVEIVSDDGLLVPGKITIMLAAGETQRLDLPGDNAPTASTVPAGEKKTSPAPLPLLHGPIEIRLRDPDHRADPPFASRKIRVGIVSPREYVRVTDIRFDPATARNEGKNRLSVTLQAMTAVPGPPIPAQLVLPAQRIPGFRGVQGGTFQGEISNKDKLPPLTLFAEKILVAPGLDDEGPVYLNIDGVARAFVFRTTFGRSSDPATPRGDGRPALRIVAQQYNQSKADFVVPIEVDNAPAGSTLEVALGRFSQGEFQPDSVKTFLTPKQSTIGIAIRKGALVLESSIQDWQAVFDTLQVLGPRTLQARLLDENGAVILDAMYDIVIDGNLPNVVRFLDPPARVKRGTAVNLRVQTLDADSGIAQVVFFVGRPRDGKIPMDQTTFAAAALDPNQTTWSAKVPLPEDGKGPTPISVQVTNKVGLSRFETAVIDLTETEPGVGGPGQIKGKVVEADRPQAGLDVVLRDEKGKELAKTKTKADGTYVFPDLKPGNYSVFCLKPTSLRRAALNVVVEAGKTSTADLSLSL